MSPAISEKVSAELFKALSDETRLRIVHALFEREQCVSDLMRALRLSQSHVSHHLKILKTAGLLEANREGHRICYRLRPRMRARVASGRRGALKLGCCEVIFPG